MSDRFDNWFEFVLRWEGEKFEDDPDDPGGATKYGIDQRSHPHVRIRELTRDGAKQIYRAEYWNRVRAKDLPLGVGEVVADIGVNNGVPTASRWLQRATGQIEDGVIGPKTIAAAQRANKDELIDGLLTRREELYRSIGRGRQAKYLRGWLNRNNDLRRFVNA